MADILFADAASARQALLEALGTAGHVVSIAHSRAEVLAAARHASDLGVALVAPSHLGVEGPGLARSWRGAVPRPTEGGPELHLVMHAPHPRTVEACLEAGADAVHQREGPPGLIVASVGAALRRQRALRALRASCDDALSRRLVDEATGMFNQRYLRLRLREEVERCGRHPRALALMLLEVGHDLEAASGRGGDRADAVLEELGRRAQGALRSYDLVARAGPWALAVLLPDLPLAHAHGLGRRLLATLRAAPVVTGAAPPFTVRVRMGIAGAAGVDQALLAADLFAAARAASEDASEDGGPVLRRAVSQAPTTA